MPYTLAAFWHMAAALSGKIDLSDAFRSHGASLHKQSASALKQAGLRSQHVQRLVKGSSREVSFLPIPLNDPRYPNFLSPLPYAPPVLFCAGNIALLHVRRRVAVVGARRCSSRGSRMATLLARDLSRSDIVVVSGLAHGIDHAAHMASGGRTIAVLGQGLETACRSSRLKAIQNIIDAGGLVLSEFLPEHPAAGL